MEFKSGGFYASCFSQQEKSQKVVVSMHQVFINKEAVLKIVVSASSVCQLGRNLNFWSLCIMCLSRRKQFKNCGVCIMRLSTRKEFKSCVSMHHVFINKEAV